MKGGKRRDIKYIGKIRSYVKNNTKKKIPVNYLKEITGNNHVKIYCRKRERGKIT